MPLLFLVENSVYSTSASLIFQSVCVSSMVEGYDYIVPGSVHDGPSTRRWHHIRIRLVSWQSEADRVTPHEAFICDCLLGDDTRFMLNLVSDSAVYAVIGGVNEHRARIYCTKAITTFCVHARLVPRIVASRSIVQSITHVLLLCCRYAHAFLSRDSGSSIRFPQGCGELTEDAPLGADWDVCPINTDDANWGDRLLYSVAADDLPDQGCALRGLVQRTRTRDASGSRYSAKCVSHWCTNVTRCTHEDRVQQLAEFMADDMQSRDNASESPVDHTRQYTQYEQRVTPRDGPFSAPQQSAFNRRMACGRSVDQDAALCVCACKSPVGCTCLQACTTPNCTGRLVPDTVRSTPTTVSLICMGGVLTRSLFCSRKVVICSAMVLSTRCPTRSTSSAGAQRRARRLMLGV